MNFIHSLLLVHLWVLLCTCLIMTNLCLIVLGEFTMKKVEMHAGSGSGPSQEEAGLISLNMALVTARRALLVASFAVALAVLSATVPAWLAAWPTLVLIAAYLAMWTTALAATRLPKTFVENIDKKAVLVTGESLCHTFRKQNCCSKPKYRLLQSVYVLGWHPTKNKKKYDLGCRKPTMGFYNPNLQWVFI